MIKIPHLLLGLLPLFASPLLHAQLPLSVPAASPMRLGLIGTPADGFGITGYRNVFLDQPDTGHLVSGVVLNAPDPHPNPLYKLYADYYITGIDNSPFTKPSAGVAAARATTPFNLVHLPAYLGSNSLSYGDIHFRFGQATAGDIDSSWNLGGDAIGQDWSGSLASSIEQRIYAADPGSVEASLWFAGVKIITFGYSSLYEVIDFGATGDPGDDVIRAYSDAVVPFIVAGLSDHALGVAEAFLDDVFAGGGLVRLDFDTIQPVSYSTNPEAHAGKAYIHANYAFSGSISIIPEPAHIGLGAAFAALGLVAAGRRRRRAA